MSYIVKLSSLTTELSCTRSFCRWTLSGQALSTRFPSTSCRQLLRANSCQYKTSSKEQLVKTLSHKQHNVGSRSRALDGHQRCSSSTSYPINVQENIERSEENIVRSQERITRSQEDCLPYDSIPTPKGLPLIGTMLDLIRSGSAKKIHEYTDRRFKELGPIYKEKLGNVEAVFICDSCMMRDVYRNEERYPLLLLPEPWVIYNDKYKRKRGLLFMTGEEWFKYRKILNKPFISQKTTSHHLPTFLQIHEDLINKWQVLPQRQPVPNLESQLYHWFIECTGVMLFGSRLGYLDDSDVSSRHLDVFAESVKNLFEESSVMSMVPPSLAANLNLPVWKRFAKAADTAFEIAEHFVKTAMKQHGHKDENSILDVLLRADVQEKDIIRILADLYLAAADTTSHTTQWSLHLLAKHQDVQERVYQEIKTVTKGQPVHERHLPHLSLVKGVVKEAQRLHSVAPFLTKITTEALTVNGYNIPPGKLLLMSLYTSGRDKENFPQPDVVCPERWTRGCARSTMRGPNAGNYQPFGMGKRSCIGKRLAELNMHLFIARLLQRFTLKSENDEEVDMIMRLVVVPSQPIKLSLAPR